MLAEITQSLALKQLHSARWYERRGHRVSAIYLYKRLIQQYPTTPAAQSALERLEALGALDQPVTDDHATSKDPSP